jgi:general secretion pathway protein L
MSTLILLLPPQPRLSAAPQDLRNAPAEFEFVHSVDGVRVTQHGRAAPGALPPAAIAVAVVAPGDVAFQKITVPKAPAARMRLALSGVLEDALLEDESDVHLALAPEARAGTEAWVAAINRPWLKAQLDALDAAGLPLERVVPAWWPEAAPEGYVFRQNGELQLAWRDAQGPICVPLASPMARALLAALPEEGGTGVRWSASPDAAGAASEFAGVPVAAVTEGEHALLAARSGWNLRQFDLAQQRRGVKLVRDAATRFAFDPAWRMTRIGVAALLVLQLVGLNVRAWQEQHAITLKKQGLVAMMHTTFPNVKTIYDAPAQAQQEIDVLRAAAGHPGDGDLETLMQAAESAWPPNRSPVDALRFESRHLTIGAAGWSPQEIDPFRSQLRAAGVDVDASADKLVLSPAKGGPAPVPSTAGAAATPPPEVRPAGPAPAPVPQTVPQTVPTKPGAAPARPAPSPTAPAPGTKPAPNNRGGF